MSPRDPVRSRPDVSGFVEMLRTAGHARVRNMWDPEAPAVVTRAPGRLDVMGGIADYSGSLVLQLPVREATMVALQRDRSDRLTIITLSRELSDSASVFSMPLRDLEDLDRHEDARVYFRKNPERSWAAYVAGAFLVLLWEKRARFPEGARLVIQSDLPEGKGVASSAALEVAVLMAVDGAYGIGLEGRDVAILCQKVENLVVGAPCGIMDQMTAVFGEENRLLALLCQPAEIEGSLVIPEPLAFWGVDSGIHHAVSGADYTSVRVGTFMGYRILQDLAGTDWGGYLANLTPSELEQSFARYLPETMTGADFLERYGETTDPVTRVDPAVTYAVRVAASHPVYEHFRLRAFSRLLKGDSPDNAPLLGELMYQSHASYSACGLGSEGTDRIVELARASGPERGIYGAKITGGGSGGTVAILGRNDSEASICALAEEYAKETGRRPYVFAGSSPGARWFGHVRFQGRPARTSIGYRHVE